MARPRKELDKRDFEGLLSIGCSLAEVTAFFDNKLGGCSEDTVERWCKREYKNDKGKGMTFAEVSAKKGELRKISVRRNLLRLSEKNASVVIFLAKNWLGMRDQPEDSIDMEDSDAYLKAATADDKSDHAP